MERSRVSPRAVALAESLESRRLLAVPGGFVETVVATGLTSPATMAFAPDGRLFIAQQNGNVMVVKDGRLLPTPFVNLLEDDEGERGLLGIAFDPDFQNNKYVYVYYTRDDAFPLVSHNVVSRLTADGDVAAPGSEQILFELPDVGSAIWHMGGSIQFGPDGRLYVAVGDYQQPNNSQSLQVPMGKILRINKDGSIPTDNPFYNQTSGVNRAIWAMGLRNPFTTAFQPGTGRFYINDVGQGSFEEVNQGEIGKNYGWPQTEGTFNPASFPNFTNPIHAYGRNEGCAVMGGVFYDGVQPNFPQQYHGKYFFADFCNGWVRTLDPVTRAVGSFGTGFSFPVNVTAAPDGTLWVLTRGQQTGGLPDTGAVRKIEYTLNRAPQISAHPQAETTSPGEPVTFRVEASGSPPLSYQWRRNGVDIPGATGASYTLDAPVAGDDGARFRVVVSSPFGTVTSDEAVLRVTDNRAPVPTITSPADGTTYGGGQTITYSGTATDAEDGVLPPSAFTWRVDLHHDEHAHPFMPPTSGVTGGSFVIPTTGETSPNVWYRIHLTVADSEGITRSVFRDVQPRKATLNLLSNVPGVPVLVDGQPKTTPHALVGVEGIERSFEAPALPFAGGASHQFLGWPHQQGTTFQTRFPAADGTYLALYRTVGTAYLSDMEPVGTPLNGWGPYERDRSNAEQAPGDGRPLTLNGAVYPKGLGVHANSQLEYDLGGRFKTFEAVVGVDDEVGNNGSVVFEVWADGARLYQSGVLRGPQAGVPVSVDVAGRQRLRLVVANGGDNINYDHADWADARLIANATPLARVNFTNATGDAVGGYVPDTGAVFGPRAGGLSYGWGADNTANARDYDAGNSPDERYDSLNHLQRNGRDDVWEVAVPDGTYLIRLAGGDPGLRGDVIRLEAEGVLVASGTTTLVNNWIEGRALVRVADGRLTVRSGAGAVNNKINFIEIDRLDDAPARPSTPAPFVATAASPTRVNLSWGAVPGAGGYVLRRTGGNTATQSWVLGPGATTFSDEGLAPGTAYHYTLSAYDGRGPSVDATASATTPAGPASVAGRHVFHNNSYFDGRDPAAGAADDGAIAPDKSALPPGQAGGFANVTSYTRGINGIMVDLRGAWGRVTADDFQFDAGLAPAQTPAPPPTSLTVRAGAGVDGSDRVTLVWPDGSIRNTWLRVTVKANADTGLAAPDVFSFGNLVGETGLGTGDDDTVLTVNAFDLTAVRRNLFPRKAAPLSSPYDFNRDGRVNSLDLAAVRAARSRQLPLTPPAPSAPASAASPDPATALVRAVVQLHGGKGDKDIYR